MNKIWIALACLICTNANAAHQLDGRDIDNGHVLYVENCASCHGENLEGQPNWQSADDDGVLPAPPHDETGHTWHHDNELLFNYTKFGGDEALKSRGITNVKSGMPAAEGILTDDEIWNVLAYIRSTWPQRIQDVQDARNPPHN